MGTDARIQEYLKGADSQDHHIYLPPLGCHTSSFAYVIRNSVYTLLENQFDWFSGLLDKWVDVYI